MKVLVDTDDIGQWVYGMFVTMLEKKGEAAGVEVDGSKYFRGEMLKNAKDAAGAEFGKFEVKP